MNLLDIYKGFSQLYENNHKFILALKYLKLHDKLQDELFDDKRESILAGEDKSIQIGEINHRIEKVEKENKNYIKILNYNKYFIAFLILLALIFLSLLYFLNKNFQKNKKINEKLKSANIELHNAKEKTIEVTKLKSQFMSTVSHELRTPLYGVIGLTDIIESEHAELKNSKYIKSLKFSAKYLLSLINDVLNLSKIESGNISLIYETINLKEQIEIITDSLAVIANQYNNTIRIEYSDDVPKYIKTDKTRLSQIIINLLSNSLKFTKEGTVTIKIYVDKDLNFIFFEIKDTGI
jgi:signal transduction histidine kinase